MKNLTTVIIALYSFAILANSCKKLNEAPKVSFSISGKWSLLSDSTYSSFQTIGPATVNSHTYLGLSTDYYDFKPDSSLSIQYGSFETDTASYSLNSKTLIIRFTSKPCINCINFTNDGSGTFTINTLTAHSLIINSRLVTPEGPESETMKFSR